MVLDIIRIYAIILAIGFSVNATKSEYVKENDKLVLDPIGLIDILIEEHKRSSVSVPKKYLVPFTKRHIYDKLNYKLADNIVDDAETLKRRKMWSRWSKWSDCSVTCGEGSITRRRTCVAGRCAPHEIEEQRRPCARPPCSKYIAEDFHDLD